MVSTPHAAYWEPRSDSRVDCSLCFHRCSIAPGKSGMCGVRRNEGGVLRLPYYGIASSVAVDPIEKKPLHHFLPGSAILSVGFFGCNLRCPFCQNWEISQDYPDPPSRRIEPGDLITYAKRAGTPSIAYTYSEPSVHFEFVSESMRLARSSGLRTVLVTNGSLREPAALELLNLTDAVNVDLKCWSPESYSKVLGGDLETVMGFIRAAARLCHVEVTTLVVPGLSDSIEGIDAIAAFLASLAPAPVFHLSAYHPSWRYTAPSTPPELVSSLAETARKHLPYVYVGNVPGSGSDTICPNCGSRVIRRRFYSVDTSGLSVKSGSASCTSCGSRLPIVVT